MRWSLIEPPEARSCTSGADGRRGSVSHREHRRVGGNDGQAGRRPAWRRVALSSAAATSGSTSRLDSSHSAYLRRSAISAARVPLTTTCARSCPAATSKSASQTQEMSRPSAMPSLSRISAVLRLRVEQQRGEHLVEAGRVLAQEELDAASVDLEGLLAAEGGAGGRQGVDRRRRRGSRERLGGGGGGEGVVDVVQARRCPVSTRRFARRGTRAGSAGCGRRRARRCRAATAGCGRSRPQAGQRQWPTWP